MTFPTNARTTVLKLDRPGDPSVFDEATRASAAELIARYPAGQERSALLPLLHLVQSVQSHVGPDGIAFCADILGIQKAQVAAVATFYTMYKKQPVGEYLVSVCTNTLCGLLGGDEIYAAMKDKLGVGMNETTPDGRFTLEHAECLAACDYAPVVAVNYEFYDNQDVASTTALIDALATGTRPDPTRGAPLCSFREIQRQIAGFADERPEGLEAAATGPQTQAGVRLAQQRGQSAPSYSIGADTGSAAADAAASRTVAQPTSNDDAPLTTSASDPDSAGEK